ncbi:MAG TPA: FAD-dependent oxidoreductase [Candidatus Dormibacteraeota bacterium]|jgi:uncharacterized protein with NAD-binding domain and iron-sulfur cluster|nr:FAD-dependent oxidoreductase [Candidatus Dormibacteraeota bacterium]
MRVAVLGGGVGGMTAAHELAERGFDVVVFEEKDIPGGKARSMPARGTGTGGRRDLPGEHGFRFFPGFYRHVPDTMGRISLGHGAGTVLDHLVTTTTIDIARRRGRNIVVPASVPTRPSELRGMLTVVLRNLLEGEPGLTPADVAHFSERLLVLLASCSERRLAEHEHVRWWDFVGAEERSPQYRQFLADGLTRCLVAAKAREISARTAGYILLQLLLEQAKPWGRADRVLDGPTNDVWIGPWLQHLRGLGVDYRLGYRVDRIECSGDRITGVVVSRLDRSTGRRVERTETADHYVAAVPVEVLCPPAAGDGCRRLYGAPRAGLVSDEMIAADPGLGRLGGLRTRWMNGVIFYLRRDVPIVRGHTLYIDSPWALTSISQAQFWRDADLGDMGDGSVAGILSVDVSDWERPGEVFGRAAVDCTLEEVGEEVWTQIRRRVPELRDSDRAGWFVDPDITWPSAHPQTNLEPLLINTAGSWELRPEARTGIRNLFLAADYVRTHTDLATMEGASEAGRRAVNGILDESGSDQPRCRIWPLREPEVFAPLRMLDVSRFRRGLPVLGDTSALGRELPDPLAGLRGVAPAVLRGLGRLAGALEHETGRLAERIRSAPRDGGGHEDDGLDGLDVADVPRGVGPPLGAPAEPPAEERPATLS